MKMSTQTMLMSQLKQWWTLWHVSGLVSQIHQMENCLTYAFNNKQSLATVLKDRNRIRELLNNVLGVIGSMIGDIEVYMEENGIYPTIHTITCPDVYNVMLVVENPMLHLAWVYEILQMVESDVEELSRLSKTPRGQWFYDHLMPMAIDMSQLKVLMVNLEKIAQSPNNDDDGVMKMEKSQSNDHPTEAYKGDKIRVLRLHLNLAEDQILSIFYNMKKSTEDLYKISKQIFHIIDSLMGTWPPDETIFCSRTLVDAKLKCRSCLISMLEIVVIKMMTPLELMHETHCLVISNEEVSRDNNGQMDLTVLVKNPKKHLLYLTNLVRQLEFSLLKCHYQISQSVIPEHFIRYANVLRDGLVNVDQVIIEVFQLCQPQEVSGGCSSGGEKENPTSTTKKDLGESNLAEDTKGEKEKEKKMTEFKAQINLCAALILGLGEDNEEVTAAAAAASSGGQMDKEELTTTLSDQMTLLSLVEDIENSDGEKITE
jgi:hypothetical protein